MGAATDQKPEIPEGPVIIRDGHVQDRIISPVAGAPKAWRKLSPLESTFDKGQLRGGSPLLKYDARARFEAGRNYEKIWMIAQSAGTDSTQAMSVSNSYGGNSLPQSQQSAIRDLVNIESHMGRKDRLIVRAICGIGVWPAEAIRTVCADYEDAVTARTREALDSLIEAFEAVARTGKTQTKSRA